VYLKYLLDFILTFVGVKMVIVDFYHFPIIVSLAVILVTLAVAIIASLKFPPAPEKAAAHPHETTGSIFANLPPEEQQERE
jgi:tellurite resistance protein TerC